MRFTHQPGAQPLSGYTIQRGIHRGGFGEVYYARSDGGKEVALKLLQRDQDVELRGVRQCLNLKHPNLVNLFDVRTDDAGEQWVVMEYVNGTSLEDVLASLPNGLPLDEVQEWLDGIAAGVTHLHDRGIVHRDLKPANVYRENGTVKVGDVGLSKRLGADRRGAHTQSVGTVYYMAPEVANGQYGPEVDVYGLGIILYEMLTGQLPFMGETTAEVLMKHLTAPVNLDGISDEFRGVVSRALAKDPRQRTGSAMQLSVEFQTALDRMKCGSGQTAARRPNVAVAFATTRFAETGATSSAMVETGRPVRMVGRPPISVRTSAQAASAYAQYPPELPPGLQQEKPSVVEIAPKPINRPRPVSSKPVQASRPQTNWGFVGLVLLGLILFCPGTLRSWTGIGLIGAAIVATRMLRGKDGRRLDTSLVSVNPSVDVQVCTELSESTQALGDTAVALTVGSISATLISIGTLLSLEFFRKSPSQLSPEFLAMFVTTSLAATWSILFAVQLGRHSQWIEKNSRKTGLAIGALLGCIAFGLDRYLMLDFGSLAKTNSPVFQSIGVHRLIESNLSPTLLGYVVFFGCFLFLHSWWQDASPRRSLQLSFGRLGAAAVTAWLLTLAISFPLWPAILWAVTISAAVQLATPWPIVRRGSRRS